MEVNFNENDILTFEEFEASNELASENNEPATQEMAGESEDTLAQENSNTELDETSSPIESVGKEELEETSNTPSSKGSPHVYSSLAKALKEEGVLLDTDDEKIKSIKGSEDFVQLIEDTIQERLSEKQRRINDALETGVEPNTIKVYENTIEQLDSITEEQLESMSDDNIAMRKQIIYRDYLNKGFSENRAAREVENAIKNRTDIEDAKESLQSLKKLVKSQYDTILQNAKDEKEERDLSRKGFIQGVCEDVFNSNKFFGELELDKKTKQKVVNNLFKPIYQDKETGLTYSAIQEYERNNKAEFLKNVAIVYTLTDGFKDLSGLVKGKVKKEVGNSMKELEKVLNGSQIGPDGALNLVSSNDDNSIFRTFTLDDR